MEDNPIFQRKDTHHLQDMAMESPQTACIIHHHLMDDKSNAGKIVWQKFEGGSEIQLLKMQF